jgi:hypothetical protein
MPLCKHPIPYVFRDESQFRCRVHHIFSCSIIMLRDCGRRKKVEVRRRLRPLRL